MKSNYDKFPHVDISGFDEEAWQGWVQIRESITKKLSNNSATVIIECYHGLYNDELISELRKIPEATLIDVSSAYKVPDEIHSMIYPDITDDPVFGKLTSLSIEDYFREDKLLQLRKIIEGHDSGILIIYGTGATLVADQWDLLVYADMARWEIQLRMRKNRVNNLGVSNLEQSFSLQYKHAYFVDWRVCDRIKLGILDKVDFLLDTNIEGAAKMITGNALRQGLDQTCQTPFRLVPFFDPGPWGGQWMKEVCDLDRSKENFAWCFDCVPEENSLLLKYGEVIVEIPSVNLLFYRGEALLGREVYEVFGPEFPIRFDFLDTMGGGNLSMQVHPLTEYIREHFGMTYTQDESYYMLDTEEDAIVYLGLKEGINPENMIKALKDAQNGGPDFPADEYVESWKVKKHDHILIPAGTVHCSGKNSMVLEISATPYIFTFKLWDWGRMGLDGKPRPINIERGIKVIQWDRTTTWTGENLVNQVTEVEDGPGWREERTGLHELEFIETRRHWFTGKVIHHTEGKVNVLNLVEGREALVESPDNSFAPFKVHYAETFVVPATVDTYSIKPVGESIGKECATVKAYVRTESIKALGKDLRMLT